MSKKCMGRGVAAVLALLAVLPCGCSSGEQVYTEMRMRMVREDIAARGISDMRVLESMRRVPRHLFVPDNLRDVAYIDSPLPIGGNQTISQPYIVALMTESLGLGDSARVLEIGTGSGYQAAVLSELVKQVYSIEIVVPLGEQAKQRFKELGYTNITSKIADGYYGWEEYAPFDAIMVTAAASHVPHALIEQLKPGGRMMIPVGSHFMTQQLLLISKEDDDKLVTRQIIPVRFVPLTGKH